MLKEDPQDTLRQSRNFIKRHNVLTDKFRLKDLEILKQLSENQVYSKIEKRIAKIREKIQEERTLFDVDQAHDWNCYLPEWNLSRLKEVWNRKQEERRITMNMTRGLSKFGYLKQFL